MSTSDSEIAITVDGLGKWYVINELRHRRTLSERIGKMITAPFRIGRAEVSERVLPEAIWAVKDVSFNVPRGSVMGVIGTNGSGKSTLLKILARITAPTIGQAILNGRVGALLEVGTGFHPDLSGRENILLNGTMIGMTAGEIRRCENAIIEFSEVGDFIDTPVKHYSSGMFMRLAFAVAAHLEAEIMLVDEVLAVGDAAFQEKCKRKIGEIASQGRTVLFTSHDMAAVKRICHSCLVLEKGRVAHWGGIDDGIRRYNKIAGMPPELGLEPVPLQA
jgi:lipopolysaccharide transport system ATP-binding protein